MLLRRGQLGVTLIELIAAIVLTAIMAAVAIPRMAVLSDYETRGLRDKLAAELQYARQAAIANRRYVCVDTTNGTGGKVSLTIESAQPEDTAGTCPKGIVLNPPAPDKTIGCAANQICASSRTSLSASQVSFQFDPLGRLSTAGTVSFTIPGETTIAIETETGYVR